MKCVFNIDLKRSSDSSGIRMFSGSEFQTTGLETRKLLGPKQRVLVRDTDRSPRRADRRRALAPTSRTGSLREQIAGEPWHQPPDRIAGAAEVCRTSAMEGIVDKDRDLEVDTLTKLSITTQLKLQITTHCWYHILPHRADTDRLFILQHNFCFKP